MLELMLEEYFDLAATIKELETKRDLLRNAIKLTMNAPRLGTPRGTARIDRYATFEALRLSPLVPFLAAQGWEEETLCLKGRTLHKMAKADETALVWLRDSGLVKEEVRETLVITPVRAHGLPKYTSK